MRMIYDIIIVGGGFAGIAAAEMLVKFGRVVLICEPTDSNEYERTYANVFFFEGRMNRNILREKLLKMQQDSGLNFCGKHVATITKTDDCFKIKDSDGASYFGTTVLLATGLTIMPPAIPGFVDGWGKSIHGCWTCAFDLCKNMVVGIYGNGLLGLHVAQQLTGIAKKCICFTDEIVDEQVGNIAYKLGVEIVRGPIVALNCGKERTTIIAADGTFDVRQLIWSDRSLYKITLPEGVSVKIQDSRMEVDELMMTSIPEIFACGDLVEDTHSVNVAIASGYKAGLSVNKYLSFQELGKLAAAT